MSQVSFKTRDKQTKNISCVFKDHQDGHLRQLQDANAANAAHPREYSRVCPELWDTNRSAMSPVGPSFRCSVPIVGHVPDVANVFSFCFSSANGANVSQMVVVKVPVPGSEPP